MPLLQAAFVAMLVMTMSPAMLRAQRAAMNVSAVVLPSAAQMESGSFAPSASSGNMMVASARLQSVSAAAVRGRASSRERVDVTSAPTDLTLGIVVSANAPYAVRILDTSADNAKLQASVNPPKYSASSSMSRRSSGAVVPINYSIPAAKGIGMKAAPVVVVVTVASIA